MIEEDFLPTTETKRLWLPVSKLHNIYKIVQYKKVWDAVQINCAKNIFKGEPTKESIDTQIDIGLCKEITYNYHDALRNNSVMKLENYSASDDDFIPGVKIYFN
jgi:hypothetical protein